MESLRCDDRLSVYYCMAQYQYNVFHSPFHLIFNYVKGTMENIIVRCSKIALYNVHVYVYALWAY